MNFNKFHSTNAYLCYDVDKICAVCNKVLENMPRTSVNTMVIAEKDSIKAYRVLELISNFKLCIDGPQFLCSICFKNTAIAYKLQTMCNKAQMLFDNYLMHKHQTFVAGNIKTEIDINETVLEIPSTIVDDEAKIKAEFKVELAYTEDDIDMVITSDDDDDKINIINMKETNSRTPYIDENADCQNSIKEPRTQPLEKNCQFCYKPFYDSIKLAVHERIHAAERPYICKICRKSFAHASQLTIHEREHNGERPYACKICNKAFAHSSQLTGHSRIHAGERPYRCKICNKAFSYSSQLTVHEKIHAGNRPFQCKFCDKAFVQSDTLMKHERRHTGELQFSCKFCDKSFGSGSSLTSHTRTHTGERPFQCKICKRSFTQRACLVAHEKAHTAGVRPFLCCFCEKTFTNKWQLSHHQRREHKECNTSYTVKFIQ